MLFLFILASARTLPQTKSKSRYVRMLSTVKFVGTPIFSAAQQGKNTLGIEQMEKMVMKRRAFLSLALLTVVLPGLGELCFINYCEGSPFGLWSTPDRYYCIYVHYFSESIVSIILYYVYTYIYN